MLNESAFKDDVELYASKLTHRSVRKLHVNDLQTQSYIRKAMMSAQVKHQNLNTFAPYNPSTSASRTLTAFQIILLVLTLFGLISTIVVYQLQAAAVLFAFVIFLYFGNLLVHLALSIRTILHSSVIDISKDAVDGLGDSDCPTYTVLCPLYQEVAVVPQFVQAMERLEYPTDKLQILLLTEESDEATRKAILALDLPANFEVVTVPDGQPRTKPRACNYGLLKATGEYVVIYDAEDIPDPLQLKKAVLAFTFADENVGCVQAKLSFYNQSQNLLTRWFSAEYTSWFEMVLPGLQSVNLSLPLGGTSNHFRTKTLQYLGAWGPFNVTEDCDLGLRLSRHGFRTVILNSTTYEEANSDLRNWLRQRSRWIKGYLQTYLVYMRNPFVYLAPSRWREFWSIQLLVGFRTYSLFVNPILWVLILVYFVFTPQVRNTYEQIFFAPVLYLSIICLIFGNFIYVYTHLIAASESHQYNLVRWSLLMPIYWMLGSAAACVALYQLITKPHYWEKTEHGLHLVQKISTETTTENTSSATRMVPLAVAGFNAFDAVDKLTQSTAVQPIQRS